MTLTAIQTQQVIQEWQAYTSSLLVGQTSLANVIAAGTILYNDANFATLFPNTYANYKTYLLAVQSAIDTFEASFPATPSL